VSTLFLASTLPGMSQAQDRPDAWGWGWRRVAPRFPSPSRRDRRFTFVRLIYRSAWREWGGQGWSTDYPEADINLMRRFAELTRGAVARDSAGGFDHIVVPLTDDRVYSYPMIYTSDVGTLEFSEPEAARLRDYLLKGGFLWVDDFWGDRGWSQWEREIGKALPPSEYPIFDLPLNHPLFHSLYEVKEIPQIPSIQFWRRSGGGTSERGPESAVPHLRGIAEKQGRLIVLITHNTDIADGWEREGEEYEYFLRFSPVSYALAVNIVLYVMTH
jgi:hypothetical protein